MKAYAVVAFLGENSVSAVPCSWVLPGNTLCLWPGDTAQAEVSNLIRKAVPPGKGFGAHPIRLLKWCSTFQKAKKKARIAEDTSCLSSSEDTPSDAPIEEENVPEPEEYLRMPAPPSRLRGEHSRSVSPASPASLASAASLASPARLSRRSSSSGFGGTSGASDTGASGVCGTSGASGICGTRGASGIGASESTGTHSMHTQGGPRSRQGLWKFTSLGYL